MPDTIPSQIDLRAPFDPTALTEISGADLLQLVAGAVPNTDKGLIFTTTDISGLPQVPDAGTFTKWQVYFWRRVLASGVAVYVWNPTKASDATLLRWDSINAAGIAAGSITNSMIGDLQVDDSKISNVDWSKVVNAPSSITNGGAAGGTLAGTYPNPTLAPASVVSSNIVDLNVTGAKLEAGSQTTGVPVTKLQCNANAADMQRTNAGATAMEFFTPPKIFTTTGIPVAANGKKVIRVNAGATDYEAVTSQGSSDFGRILQQVMTTDNTADGTTNTGAITTIPAQSGGGVTVKVATALSTAFTPVSAASTLYIEVCVHLVNTNSGTSVIAALFQDATVSAIGAGAQDSTNSGRPCAVHIGLSVASGSTSARTYKVGFGGTSNTTNYNSTDGSTKLFGGTLGTISWIKITEYL